MYKLFILTSLITLLTLSCESESQLKITSIPDCVQSMIDKDTNGDILTIRVKTSNGVYNYWINTDARTWDGIEEIVNEQCDVVCTVGGQLNPDRCFEYNNWKVIWKK